MQHKKLTRDAFFWALQGMCALHRKPYSADLAHQQLAAPHTPASLRRGAEAYGFVASLCKAKPHQLQQESFPLIAWLQPKPAPR